MALPDTWEHQLGVAEWEPRKMTICIAAICEAGKTIVVTSDREYNLGFTSAQFNDGKFHSLFKDWYLGLAGTVTHATEIMGAAARAKLESLASFDVISILEKSYRKAR